MPQTIANGTRTYFRLEGVAGSPVVALLHPIGADHSLYDKVTRLLVSDFQVLRPDLRGHGGSEVVPGEYRVDELAEDFVQLCTEIGAASVHICGVSLGGMVAAAAAARHPDLVASLVLCSTPVRLPAPPGGWDARASAMMAQGMSAFADGMVHRMISPAHLAQNDPDVGTLKTVFTRMDPRGYAGACAVLRDVDLATMLPTVRCRTLVVTGAQDPLLPQDTGQATVRQLANGEHVRLACGHFPPLEEPQDFARELRRWFASA